MKNAQLLQVSANAPADADVIVIVNGKPVVVTGAEFDMSAIVLRVSDVTATDTPPRAVTTPAAASEGTTLE